MAASSKNFLWLDMEMSGLDVTTCRILEVAAIVTDENFKSLAEYQAIVHQPQAVLDAMDAWCTEHHGKSGLTAAVKNGLPEAEVEKQLLDLINKFFTKEDRPVLCGNSIGQDRKFIDKYMPTLAQRLHYRMVDVTSFKEIFRVRFGIEHKKANAHRALGDIHESIAELNAYMAHVKTNT